MLSKTENFENRLTELSELAKALSHPARISILEILAEKQQCICGELVDELPLAQASVSRHLKALKVAGLIKGEVDGPKSCYCLNVDKIQQFKGYMDDLFKQILKSPPNDECC